MMIAVVVVLAVLTLGVTVTVLLVDHTEEREHREAEPVNRVVGDDRNRHNRIYD